ncbi:hypothetical protein F4821DRAFT_20904 [Hypoxylon rubiginosum]|uniref:Uncharacterized protein n=1 Tax=Hypoxylon rubiginosum TaxID=110542 RepID=A0ACC0DCZ6_9PEZI|nr:hypothetical protein F4821DRAFT_20904 [Hypoxylon rubiginosum]
MARKHEYKPLIGEEKSDIQNLESPCSSSADKDNTRSYILNLILIIAVVISFSLNIVQLGLYKLNLHSVHEDGTGTRRSIYAGLLEGDVKVYWNQSGAYTDPDDDVRDHLWDQIDIDSGIVAVPKIWAKEKGLPEGTTFPWDTDKSLYFVNAYHSLHCLKNVYRAFRDHRMGAPPTVSHAHVIHCLDQLLADTFCQADDTLRVTNRSTPHVTAFQQHRQCRSFDALQEWTLAHPGCYRYGNHTLEDAQPSQLPRMRFCPEGSPELEKVRAYFGKGEDWKPAEEKKWSWFD